MSRHTSRPRQPKFPRHLWSSVALLLLAASISQSHAQAPPATPVSPGSQSGAQTQDQSANQTTSQPGYTFKANSHVVLTDITVTDSKGNPVCGLPLSAFHVFDNKQQQIINSFEEHAGNTPPSAIPATTPGVYSNEFLQHLPPVLNVIVLDTTNLEITDQMYLNYELTKFLNTLPQGQLLAIYLRGGNGTYMLQNFTSDRTLLLAALHKGIPRFPPQGREYLSDQDTMRQIGAYLAQIPGRKNVIWFSGGSTLYLNPDGRIVENNPDWRATYDELEQERIAIYPVDARGLTVGVFGGMFAQHALMENVAKATGGHAFYNTNGMIEAASQVLNTSRSFYTITYSPHNFTYNNKWHAVRISLDGAKYNLSYRTGYFADGSIGSNGAQEQTAKSRTRLMAGGEKVEVSPQLSSVPIIFSAHILSTSDPALAALPPASGVLIATPPEKGKFPYSIRYTLPAADLTLRDVDGKQQVVFTVAAIAINRQGDTVVRKGERVTMGIDSEKLRAHPDAPITIDQQINLQKGDEYLYLAVWDSISGRLGTMQVALDVKQ